MEGGSDFHNKQEAKEKVTTMWKQRITYKHTGQSEDV